MSQENVTLIIPAQTKYLRLVGDSLNLLLGETAADTYNIGLAVNETLVNIIEHAYAGSNPHGSVTIELALSRNGRCFTATFSDNAEPFDPAALPWRPTAVYWQQETAQTGDVCYRLLQTPEPDPLQERGRGLFLICQLMDEVRCLVTGAGNQWRLTKSLTGKKEPNP